MHAAQSLSILQQLAKGVNPFTGNTLSDSSVCQNPKTKFALLTAIDALKKTIKITPANIKRSLNILQQLAIGVHPLTGNILSDKSVCQRPMTKRAMLTAIDALELVQKIESIRKHGPSRAFAPWTTEEVQTLVDAYKADKPLTKIASSLRRTEEAILLRLVRLGIIDPSLA